MKTKKKLLCFVSACFMFTLSACGSSDPQIVPEVTIDGHAVIIDEPLSTTLGSGLTALGKSDTTLDQLPAYGSKEIKYDTIYITIPNEDGSEQNMRTGVTSYLYNDSSDSKAASDCKIAHVNINFDVDSKLKYVEKEILVNGVNFRGMSAEEAITALEGLGFEKKEDDDLSFMIYSSEGYTWTFTSEAGEDGKLYITEIKLEKDLDIKIKE